jgi:hypothetical protein
MAYNNDPAFVYRIFIKQKGKSSPAKWIIRLLCTPDLKSMIFTPRAQSFLFKIGKIIWDWLVATSSFLFITTTDAAGLLSYGMGMGNSTEACTQHRHYLLKKMYSIIPCVTQNNEHITVASDIDTLNGQFYLIHAGRHEQQWIGVCKRM